MTSGEFDPTKLKLAANCEHPGTLYAMCYDAAGAKLYGAGSDCSVYAVDLTEEKPSAVEKWARHDNYVSSLLFLDGTLVSGGFDRRIIWTNADSGEVIQSVEAHDGWVRDLALFPDGGRVASVGDDMLLRIWDAQTGRLIQTCDGHAKETPQGYATALYAVAASPDGKVLAGGDRIGEVCLWESETGKLLGRLNAPAFYTYDPKKRVRSIGGIRSLCFSPDNTRLAIGGIGQVTNVDGFVGPCRVELWDWQAGERVFVGQDNHKAVLNHVAFHPTEPWLIGAGGGDGGGILAFWDQTNEKPKHKAKPKGHLQEFCLDESASRLFAAGYGGFQIWNYGTKRDAPPSRS